MSVLPEALRIGAESYKALKSAAMPGANVMKFISVFQTSASIKMEKHTDLGQSGDIAGKYNFSIESLFQIRNNAILPNIHRFFYM